MLLNENGKNGAHLNQIRNEDIYFANVIEAVIFSLYLLYSFPISFKHSCLTFICRQCVCGECSISWFCDCGHSNTKCYNRLFDYILHCDNKNSFDYLFHIYILGWLANLNDWKIIESLQWGSMILVLFITAPSLAATAVDFQLQIAIGSDRYLYFSYYKIKNIFILFYPK